MKKVMVFGTFDLLHKGHEYYLRAAKRYGDFLVVVVARDINAKRDIVNSESVRAANLRKLGIADKVVLGGIKDKYSVIRKERPVVICLGYDQPSSAEIRRELKKRNLSMHLVRIGSFHPEKYKSSILRKRLFPLFCLL